MKDYSQYGEQSLILQALGYNLAEDGSPVGAFPNDRSGEEAGNRPGRFLDVGAWNAETFSNTRALYNLGWSGVMVEPSPGPMHGLLKEYGNEPRITLIQAAVCLPGDGPIERLYITDDALSTHRRELADRWGDTGGFFGKLIVAALPPAEILDFGPFDFINIDTEGSSGDLLREFLSEQRSILQGFDAKYPLTRCFCVEHDGHQDAISSVADYYGYQTQHTEVNSILWREQ